MNLLKRPKPKAVFFEDMLRAKLAPYRGRAIHLSVVVEAMGESLRDEQAVTRVARGLAAIGDAGTVLPIGEGRWYVHHFALDPEQEPED